MKLQHMQALAVYAAREMEESLIENPGDETRVLKSWVTAALDEAKREARAAEGTPAHGPLIQAVQGLTTAVSCLRLAALLKEQPGSVAGKDAGHAAPAAR